MCGGGGREGGREKTVREIVFSLRERERGGSFRQTTRKSRCKHAITRKHAFAQHTHQIYTSTLARARKAHTPTHEKHSFYQHTKNTGQPGLKQKETKTASETLHVRAPHRDLMHILLDARTACAIDTHRADTQIPGKLFAFIFAWFVEGSHPFWHLASALPPPPHTQSVTDYTHREKRQSQRQTQTLTHIAASDKHEPLRRDTPTLEPLRHRCS